MNLMDYNRRANLLSLLILLLVLGATGSASAAGPVQSPSSFRDGLEATLAGDGTNLWLAAMGTDAKGKVRTEVLAYRGDRWKRLGGRSRASSGYYLQLALRKPAKGGRPDVCFGDMTPADSPRVRCFERGRWRTKSVPKRFRKMTLYGLRSDGNRLTALFSGIERKPRGKTVTRIRLARLKGSRLVPMKARLDLRGARVVSFARTASGRSEGPLEIDVMDNNVGTRLVVTKEKDGWARSAVLADRAIMTSWLSPAIRTPDGSLYFSRTNFFETTGYLDRVDSYGDLLVSRLKDGEWSNVGGGPISRGTGIAQGGIYPVDGRIWTVWQENDGEGIAFGGLFRTKVFAARLDPSGTGYDREIPLWSGRTYFPGATQAIAYRGGTVFLYARQFSPRGGLHPTVDFSHSTEGQAEPG